MQFRRLILARNASQVTAARRPGMTGLCALCQNWSAKQRPMPLSFMLPNGAISPVDLAEMITSLMPTMPYSSASATRQMRPMSRL
jgi:hypothetical protein